MSIAAYPEYENYRESDRERLDFPIPSHWSSDKARFLFRFNKGLTITKENLQDEGIPCVNYGEIHSKFGFEVDPHRHALKYVSPEYLKANSGSLLRRGDFVFADTSEDIEGSGNFTHLDSDEPTFAGYHTLIARPMEKAQTRYLAYMLDSAAFRKQVQKSVKGVKVYSISQGLLKNLEILLPPLLEQRAIAAFLGNKCAKIDEAVRIKESQIKLLRERRQILIQQAVTRGLNPDAPMKDSDIDWIGEIPAHWEVKRFTKEIDVQEGPGIMAVDFHDSGVPLIRISGVRSRRVTLDGCNYLSPVKVRRKWDHFKLSEGDLVISGSASTGFVSEVGSEAAGAILYTGLMKLRIKRGTIEKRYLEHFLASDLFAVQVELLKAGSTIAHYGPSHLGRMFVVLPPLDEQNEISAYCDDQYERVGDAIAIKESQIATLKEYKTTLINAAVTGRIKVS